MNKQVTLCALSVVCALSGWTVDARAQQVEADGNGLSVASADGSNELRLGGRIHYDFVRFNNDITQFQNRNDLRRARLTLSGKFLDDWNFRVERDVGGTSRGWKNVWLGYDGIKHWDFRAGNMIAPLGMEQQLGSNDMPLMERSLSSALSPGFLTGVQARYDRKGWTAALGYFGNPIDQELGSAATDGRGTVGRVTYAPLRDKGRVLHFGTSFERRSINNPRGGLGANPGTGFRLRARPGTGLTDSTLVDTGTMPGVDSTTTWGMEAGAIFGPVSVLAESLKMTVDRTAAPSVDFSGWHATGAWLVTGETRRYNSGGGTFGGVKPSNKWGAVELAVRYEQLDLEDGDILGGKERNLSYGVNWYLGRNFRVMYNHVRVEADPNMRGLPETVGINQLRAQVDF